MQPVDPDTATVLLLKVPMLRAVFLPELDRNDRPALVDVVTRLLSDDTAVVTGVWCQYDARLHGLATWAHATEALQDEAMLAGVL